MRAIYSFLLLIPFTLGGTIPHIPLPNGLIPVLDGRIVGGADTSVEKFPHQVSLRSFDSHRCGGSIIRAKAILTAGHCVSGYTTTYLSVVAGSSFRDGQGPKDTIKNFIVHEGFDPFKYYDDVAILFLNIGFEFNDVIQPISMAKLNEIPPAGTKAYVTGWGVLKESGSQPEVLQVVAVSIVTNSDCAVAYGEKNNVTDHMLCAGEPFGGRDACQGDSGGPLIIGSKQYGVVSWGIGCARSDYPGVYANIGTLRDWIDQRLDEFLGKE